MTTTTPRALRALFLTLTLLLAAFVGSEITLAAADRGDGFIACGSEASPCLLDAVAVEVPEDGRLAATRTARTTMRVRT